MTHFIPHHEKVQKKAAVEKEGGVGHSVQLPVLDQNNKVGHLFCKVCGVTHQCPIMSLSEAIDVYSDWIDACDVVNKDKSRQRDGGGGGGSREQPADGEEDDYDERERGGGRRRYAGGSEEEED
ncbi:hypothetical protein BC937DRAFT_88365 [Endogone sp. FLAS-F59071]|nr:hypothetical protein BC937DRAFT_88365 [Endogone sp. FLAS-F59071]|eukprot:RUS22578.1 hypothetical protein BC937DRAFT_88365 [Endogone sp. FLAS-F59071]